MYKQVSFKTTDSAVKDILIALLAEEGYEGFEETDEGLNAYIAEDLFDGRVLEEIAGGHQVLFGISNVARQNWNEEWEKNFQPVVVDDFCTVRADFHDMPRTTTHEIVITPKMSFGTGHHATTFLMIRKMRELDFANKRVLDFGAGTGILAILAEKLGASQVNAVDNEEWAYINALENCAANNCSKVQLWQGSVEAVPQQQYDIILANINRHILLHYMAEMASLLVARGTILLSGILTEDEEVITDAGASAGLGKIDRQELKNWLVLEFAKR